MATGDGDTLLSDSSVWLFGRVMRDLALASDAERRKMYAPPSARGADPAAPRVASNAFLAEALARPGAKLARIYAFSYNAMIQDLAKPALFLVHGEGEPPEAESGGGKNTPPWRAGPSERTGLGLQDDAFAGGIRVWAYDRADFTIRLDMETGTIERLLLENELGGRGLEWFVRGSAHSDKPTPAAPPRRRGRWRPSED
jgi:hypothetical protein